MSVWATIFALDDDHADDCPVWQRRPGSPVEEPTGTCSCGQPGRPWRYEASHLLPEDGGPRGGMVQVAKIPGHITRGGADDGDEDSEPWPWLRVSVGDTSYGDLVLREEQVRDLHAVLGHWLDARARTRGEQQ